jgi:hypothetical protein
VCKLPAKRFADVRRAARVWWLLGGGKRMPLGSQCDKPEARRADHDACTRMAAGLLFGEL